MSEGSEKVLGITQIPVFPLPLVLLPSELLPLHIFEPRYQQMLKDIGIAQNLFGISHFDLQKGAFEKPAINSIGCIAEIRESQTLEDGRSNIVTVGIIRYRINDYVDSEKAYLVAEVDFFEDLSEDVNLLNLIADEVFGLFKRVSEAAHKMSGDKGIFPEIPKTKPEQLSFLITAAFNLDTETKCKILETRSTSERLKRLKNILLESVGQIEERAKIETISRTNGHANKPINLD